MLREDDLLLVMGIIAGAILTAVAIGGVFFLKWRNRDRVVRQKQKEHEVEKDERTGNA
jgi:hypothetical protein